MSVTVTSTTPTQTATAAPCLSWGPLPVPQLPPIFIPGLGIPPITFPPPLPSIPCCKFSLPSFTVAITIPPLPLIGQIIILLNQEIAAALALLPTIQIPSCNF